jgi:hypothetical protein
MHSEINIFYHFSNKLLTLFSTSHGIYSLWSTYFKNWIKIKLGISFAKLKTTKKYHWNRTVLEMKIQRDCFAQTYAKITVKTAVVTLLQKFRFSLSKKQMVS